MLDSGSLQSPSPTRAEGHRLLGTFPLVVACLVGLVSCESAMLGAEGTQRAPAAEKEAGGPAGAGRVPLVIDEKLGVSSRAVPVRFGIPVPEGRLAAPGVFAAVLGGHHVRASTRALSYWPDGSVKWLRVDMVAPAISAGEKLEGWLDLRPLADRGPAGGIELTRTESGVRLSTADLEVSLSREAPFLRRVTYHGQEFLAASALHLQSDVVGDRASVRIVELEVEDQTESSTTMRAVQQHAGADGRVALEIVHRLTVYRDTPWVQWQQTLQVIAGTHRMQTWRLDMPLATLTPQLSVARVDGDPLRVEGDFAARQISADEVLRGRQTSRGRLAGTVYWRGGALGLENFWQLFPKGLSRDGGTVALEFAPPAPGSPVTLEEGFGRTHTLWLSVGDPAVSGGHAAARVAASLRPRSTPAWYLGSGAFDGLQPSVVNDRILEAAQRSAAAVFARRDRMAQWSYGLQHFGDFFDREHSMAYFGALDQEYDPGLVLALLYGCTGESRYLDWAIELAWHYADVDIASYGGVFQHRATEDHARNWIIGIMADRIGDYVRSHQRFDGTPASVGRIVDERMGAGTFERLSRSARLVLDDTASPAERLDVVLWLVARENFVAAEDEVRASVDPKQLRDRSPAEVFELYFETLARSPRARRLGFEDADAQFAGFFELYGGSWKAFPSFHVSNSPKPLRHSGDHSLVEGLVFAHWLTGEPGLREAALAVGRHHVDWLVPREIRRLPNHSFTRTVAWPLVNLVRLWELTQGIAEERALHAAIEESARLASRSLVGLPFSHHGGSIHAGITLEGLARYHRIRRDADVAKYIVGLAEYWLRNNYDTARKAFGLRTGGEQAGPGMNGLMAYGTAYAAWLSEGRPLRSVARDAALSAARPSDYAKDFAMRFRSTLRAAPYLDSSVAD